MNLQPDPTLDRYLNGDYAQKNPDWDSADASWKADKLHQLLAAHDCLPSSIVEIGCGSVAILAALRGYYQRNERAVKFSCSCTHNGSLCRYHLPGVDSTHRT